MWEIRSSRIGRIAVPRSVPPGFAAFCTTMDFDGALANGGAEALRNAIAEAFGIRSTLSTCRQVHGARVERADGDRPWRECDDCDALFSEAAETALAIKIADCLPVSLIDPASGVIAGVHSGWRGTVQRITAATLERLRSETSFDASRAFAYLGPTIRVCCFEVGEEVVEQFTGVFPNASRYVDRKRGVKPHLDVVGLTAEILREAGVAGERIDDSGLCTRCEGSIFHSFRRDGGRSGRNLAVVAR